MKQKAFFIIYKGLSLKQSASATFKSVSENHVQALTMLKERYRNKQAIVSTHMEKN